MTRPDLAEKESLWDCILALGRVRTAREDGDPERVQVGTRLLERTLVESLGTGKGWKLIVDAVAKRAWVERLP